jgi:hypothetical protein
MAKSLFGKNPDLDDIDFIEAVEAAFGITFDREPAAWSTFGDVFDAICQRVQPVERGPFPCLSASAYRRIRRALLKIVPGSNVQPETLLKALIADRSFSVWWRELEQESGLKLPLLTLTNWSLLILVAVIFAVPGVVAVSGLPGWIAVLSPMLGLLASGWLPAKPTVRTVGDLARSAAALNARQLSQSHAAIRTRDVWDSLVWIARDITAYPGQIDRGTALIG